MSDLTGLHTKRVRYQQALDLAMEKTPSRLSDMPEIHRAILFGSYAQGRRDLSTDIDLVLVMDSDQGFVEPNARLGQQFLVGVDVDLVAYTPWEFERLREGSFLRHVLKAGRVIYGKKPRG